jgi:HSP20 family protein
MAYFDFEPEERLRSIWTPILDVCERPDEVIVRVELPGVDKADIRLRWKESGLEVVGIKRRQPSEGQSCRYLCVERQHGRFRREIAIGTNVDFKNAIAKFRDGLLKVRLPKCSGGDGHSYIRIE